jgi:hypothetical protein
VAIWEKFFANPDANSGPPPYGAGENKLPYDKITDTIRVLMAAIRELGDALGSAGKVVGTLGTQNKNAVDITGGSIKGTTIDNTNALSASLRNSVIDSTNTLSLGAIKSPIPATMLNLQSLYDIVNPIGTIKLALKSDLSDIKWAGTGSTWVQVSGASGRVLQVAGSSGYGPAALGATTGNRYLQEGGNVGAGAVAFQAPQIETRAIGVGWVQRIA